MDDARLHQPQRQDLRGLQKMRFVRKEMSATSRDPRTAGKGLRHSLRIKFRHITILCIRKRIPFMCPESSQIPLCCAERKSVPALYPAISGASIILWKRNTTIRWMISLKRISDKTDAKQKNGAAALTGNSPVLHRQMQTVCRILYKSPMRYRRRKRVKKPASVPMTSSRRIK